MRNKKQIINISIMLMMCGTILGGSTSEDDLNERISKVDPRKFGSIYYDLHDDGDGATVIMDYQSDNEDYYEKIDIYFNENIN